MKLVNCKGELMADEADAEQAVLGSILIDHTALNRLAAFLRGWQGLRMSRSPQFQSPPSGPRR